MALQRPLMFHTHLLEIAGRLVLVGGLGALESCTDLPLASASSDMIGWSRVLLSHTLDAARSY